MEEILEKSGNFIKEKSGNPGYSPFLSAVNFFCVLVMTIFNVINNTCLFSSFFSETNM